MNMLINFKDIKVVETNNNIQILYKNEVVKELAKDFECDCYVNTLGELAIKGNDNQCVAKTWFTTKNYTPTYNLTYPHLSEVFTNEHWFDALIDCEYYEQVYEDYGVNGIFNDLDVANIIYTYGDLNLIEIKCDYSDLDDLATQCAIKSIERATNDFEGNYTIPCYFRNCNIVEIGSKGFLDYYLRTDDRNLFQHFCNKVIEVLNERNITFTTFESKNGSEVFQVPKTITIAKTNDKFNELKSYLKEFGGFTLTKDTLYSVRLFGKRGVYDESGKRTLYAWHSEKYCTNVLNWLNANVPNQRIKVSVVVDEDKSDAEYSRYYETECYGVKDTLLQINDHVFWV